MGSLFRQVITGANNETIAIGRVLGLIVFALFVFAVPIVALVTIAIHKMSAHDWEAIFSALQIYIPAIVLSVAGLIGLTAPSEPKARKTDDNA